jgi:hypothetical protein
MIHGDLLIHPDLDVLVFEIDIDPQDCARGQLLEVG